MAENNEKIPAKNLTEFRQAQFHSIPQNLAFPPGWRPYGPEAELEFYTCAEKRLLRLISSGHKIFGFPKEN